MNLTDLNRLAAPYRRRKRRGRGTASGLGKTAGRGTKGAGARSGFRHRVGFEGGQTPLFRRLPKRGFSNSPFRVRYDIVNLEDLNRLPDGELVDHSSLVSCGIIKNCYGRLKVLGGGRLERRLEVRAARFSAAAARRIEEAGGKATQLG